MRVYSRLIGILEYMIAESPLRWVVRISHEALIPVPQGIRAFRNL